MGPLVSGEWRDIVRRLLVATTLAVLLGGTLVACGGDGDNSAADGEDRSGNGANMLVFQDPATPIAVVPGQEFAIRVVSNASTGYAWSITQPPSAELVEVLEREGMTEADQSTNGLVGVPGTTTFVFKAKASGTTQIELTYARSFDSADSPTVESFTVNVS
jgi:predicted secreted protein